MDNLALVLTVLLNIIKDVAIVAIFGYLSYHFNNIWIMLLACLFTGGYNMKINYKENKKKDGEVNG